MNMECHNCEVRQRQFYCKSCLKTHLRDFHSQHTHYSTDLKAVISTAQSSLASTIEPARNARARVADIQARVEQLVGGLTIARKDCEKKRDRIRKLREDLAQRRRTLGTAKMLVRSTTTPHPVILPPSSSSPSSTPRSTSPQSSAPGSPEIPSSTPTPSLLATLTSPILAYAAGALATPGSAPFLNTPLPGTFPHSPSPPYGGAYPWTLQGIGVTTSEGLASPSYFPPTQPPSASPYPNTSSSASPSAPYVNPASPMYQAPGVSHSTLTTTPIPPSPPYASLLSTLTRARVGLIQELVDVFNIVEVGGRPTIGGRKGARGEWTIGSGLVLPVPGDIRRYPPDHINAVLTLTLHFINLLSFYLGVKLPFEVTWSGGKVGLGQPWIGAIKGVPTANGGGGGGGGGGNGEGSGSWARWYTKHPLHLSNSPSAQPPPPSSPPIPVPQGSISASPPSSSASSSSPLSHVRDPSSSSSTERSRTTSTSSTSTIRGTGSGRPQASPVQSPSSPTSRHTTIIPTQEPSAKRTSFMGLAKGVVGYAMSGAAGRVRTFSGSTSASPLSSSPMSGSPSDHGRLHGYGHAYGHDQGGEEGEGEEGGGYTREELEMLRRKEAEQEAALEASMINASPLPARRSKSGATRASSGSALAPARSSASKIKEREPGSERGSSSRGKDKGKDKEGGGGGKDEGAPSFTIALAMLIYNVAYLGHTQGVDIPLHQSGEVLSNLWRVCCSADVGRFGHETGGYLSTPSISAGGMGSPYSISSPGGGGGSGGGDVTPTQQSLQSHFQPSMDGPSPPQSSTQHPLHMAPPTYATHTLARLVPPTPPSFAMEFGQVLQVISTAGHRDLKSKTRVVSMRKGTSVGANASGNDGDKGKVGKIEEEEDEFDMLEGVDDGSGREKGEAGRERESDKLDGKSPEGGETGEGGPGVGAAVGGLMERRKSAGNEEWDLVEGDDDDDF